MEPNTARLLADVMLAAHVVVVAFVVGGLVVIFVGGALGWAWVRHRLFRLTHLATVVFIVVQTWLGELCPLTIWEQDLRVIAGQAAYQESFIEHWLSRLLYFDAPWWVFVAAYTVFGALVVVSWWWIPPRGGRGLVLFGRRD
jgi:hypothetical protein